MRRGFLHPNPHAITLNAAPASGFLAFFSILLAMRSCAMLRFALYPFPWPRQASRKATRLQSVAPSPTLTVELSPRQKSSRSTTKPARIAITNESGIYSIPNLPIGGYSMMVQKQGFRRYLRSGLVLSTSQILELNATLELGAITDIIEVTSLEPLVHTRTSYVDQLIETKSI